MQNTPNNAGKWDATIGSNLYAKKVQIYTPWTGERSGGLANGVIRLCMLANGGARFADPPCELTTGQPTWNEATTMIEDVATFGIER